ncbi:hypothetical protein VZT92_002524 [Zoarces viviparus]|uniref:Apolipoprotein M n=1 Tax=Zoarces viviparus TaxID=48416 RepID=A0AAW1FYS6_ZOAVI
MLAVCAIAVLCVMPVGHAAPLDCKHLVEPLGQIDPGHLEGRWALVADSLKIFETGRPFLPFDSVSVDFHNSTYTQGNRYGEECRYQTQNISIEGPNFDIKVGGSVNLRGTFLHTSCSDCVALTLTVDSPNQNTLEVCLLSRRRQLDQKELEEFRAQVECLNMPQHVVMDPTKQLCPDRSRRSQSD